MKPIKVHYKAAYKGLELEGDGVVIHFYTDQFNKPKAVVQCDGSGKFHICEIENIEAIN